MTGDGKLDGVGGDGFGLGLAEAEFARGAFGGDGSGEGQLLAGAAVGGELVEGVSGFKAERGPEEVGGVTQEAALKGGWLSGEARDVDGDGGVRRIGGAGATSTANGAAGKEELGREAIDFRLPVVFFVAGNLGHVGEMLADFGVPLFEIGEELVADAVTGVGGVLV